MPQEYEDWHRAYFCVFCGKVWARWEHEGPEQYYAIHRSCATHRAYLSERPGSLVVGKSDINLLPPALLVREFMLGEAWQKEIV